MILNIKGHELEFDDELIRSYEYRTCANFAGAAATRLKTNFQEADIDKIFREHTEQEIKNMIIKTALMEIDLYTGGTGSGCTKTPDYKINDTVEFPWENESKRGYINIVDEYGTFEQWEEPSYDILVPEEGLYKHIRESLIRKNSSYKIFDGKKSLSIPVNIMLEYEEKVSAFTENTANYFMEVLELTENMTEEALSAAVVAAMKEDCEDSECVKEILSNKEKKIRDCMEYGLPDWLVKSIQTYEKGKDSSIWDCLYCELQSDINVAEVEQLITSSQAWYLREKYLGLKKRDNFGG